MAESRLGKYQERTLTKRIILAFTGSIAIIAFILIFGLKILVGFSILVGNIKSGSTSNQTTDQVIIQPPVLDWLPEATNSAIVKLSGSGQKGLTAIIYVNNQETKKITIGDDGTFLIKDLILHDGTNSIQAVLTDGKNHTSDKSNQVDVTVNKKTPKLDINTPNGDITKITNDNNKLTITGNTESENTITVNGHIAPVSTTGSFSYDYLLSDGDNTITIIATNPAGNTTKTEKVVTYHQQ